MVRTRAGQSRKPPAENIISKDPTSVSVTVGGRPRKLQLLDFKKQVEDQLSRLETCRRCVVEGIERSYETLMMKIGPSGDMLPSELSNNEVVAALDTESLEVSTSFIGPKRTSRSACPNFATSTVRKPWAAPASPDSPPPVRRVTRQSRRNSVLTRSISEDNIYVTSILEPASTKPARRTRSVSNKRQNATLTTSKFMQTPAGAPYFPRSVTPKADPTTALRRHPRKGEFALSLTGSPLMVGSSSTEMNITLPVGNGEVYSILPTESFNAREILPVISSDTRRQIMLLRKNLDHLLGK